ncbi:MAG: glycosyltransferase family 39 protein [Thermoflexales bacterium]|nr:glycosyltransferase family 39 protein [Thermoflexales bacterium]
MILRRLQIAVIALAGLTLAGLGHHFVATQREVYPIDGYVFYVGAVLCGWWLWRTLSQAPDAVWSALRDALRAAFQIIGEALRLIGSTLRNLLPQWPVRGVVLSVIGLNVTGALAAQFIPTATWLWLALWFGSVVIVAAYVWPRLAPKVNRSSEVQAIAPSTVVIEEAEPTTTRLNPIGLLAALALLIGGQWLIGAAAQNTATGLTPLPLITALRLDLPGDANLMLAGWALLIAGTLALSVVTRGLALVDYAPLSTAPLTGSRRLLSRRWLIIAVGALVLWLSAINAVANGAHGTGGLLPWIVALGAMAACWWQIDRGRGVRWNLTIDRREALALVAAMIAITLVLTYQLGNVPNSLWGDEGGYWSLARDIARGVVTPDVFGLGAYAFPMGGSIYQAAWLNVLGLNLTAWRWSAVFAVVITALALYFLVRATLGKRAAWLSLATLTVMPYAVTYARLGYTQSLALLPVVLTQVSLWGAIRHDSRLLAFLAGGASGLAFFTHPSAHLAAILAVVWLVWMLITRRVPGRSIVWLGAAWIVGAAIVATPAIAYGVTQESEAFAGKFVESAFNNVFYARDIVPAERLAQANTVRVGQQDIVLDAGIVASLLVRGTVRTALSLHTSALARDPFLIGALAEPFGLLYLIGLAWCVARFKRPGYAVWPLWLIIGAFGLSAMSAYPPRAGLMLPIVPALAVLSALGLIVSLDLIARVLGGIPERVKVIGAIGLLGVLGAIGLRTYFIEMPERYRPDLENAMFWEAQALPRNATLMLITAAELPADYRPWGVREFDVPVAFMRLRPNELNANAWRVACTNECAIFLQAAERDAILPGLQAAFGTGTLVEYTDASGTVLFYRFVMQKS